MRICSINAAGAAHLGLVTARGVIDATAAGYPHGIDAVIAGADTAPLRALAADESLPVVDAPEYLNVVEHAGKLLCVGLNYRAHAEGVELKSADVPILFSKFANALVPCGAAVELPEWEESYDYEAELVIVMGRRAWNVSEAAAGGVHLRLHLRKRPKLPRAAAANQPVAHREEYAGLRPVRAVHRHGG